MLVRLIIGLLGSVPTLVDEVRDAIADLKSTKNGTDKLKSALNSARDIASELESAIESGEK